MSTITSIVGREILDSRGNPTVEVDVTLESGAQGRTIVPSGASKGAYEAVELRDGDVSRYFGKGVLSAVKNINIEISSAIRGMDAKEQALIDQTMISIDGTENKSRLGANSILGVSLSVAKAAANELKQPLYHYLGTNTEKQRLPVPMMNILNGGVHADNHIDIQEFMIMPLSAQSCSEAIRMGVETFHSLKKLLSDAGHNVNVGDEGGFAPNLNSTEEALDFLLLSIEAANYVPGKDIVIAIDSASTEFFTNGIYHMVGSNRQYNSDEMVKYYENLVKCFPIMSIEDGMAEDDWEGWKNLTTAIGHRVQLVGDDLFVTNVDRLNHGIQQNIANSILVKVNQIGTLSETINTLNMAHNANYTSVISHRSGETEDTTIADLAVAFNSNQIKTGSLSRSDRVAKYNQLIRIEEELGWRSEFFGKDIFPNTP